MCSVIHVTLSTNYKHYVVRCGWVDHGFCFFTFNYSNKTFTVYAHCCFFLSYCIQLYCFGKLNFVGTAISARVNLFSFVLGRMCYQMAIMNIVFPSPVILQGIRSCNTNIVVWLSESVLHSITNPQCWH